MVRYIHLVSSVAVVAVKENMVENMVVAEDENEGNEREKNATRKKIRAKKIGNYI